MNVPVVTHIEVNRMSTSPGHQDRGPEDYWGKDEDSHKEVPTVSILRAKS